MKDFVKMTKNNVVQVLCRIKTGKTGSPSLVAFDLLKLHR